MKENWKDEMVWQRVKHKVKITFLLFHLSQDTDVMHDVQSQKSTPSYAFNLLYLDNSLPCL